MSPEQGPGLDSRAARFVTINPEQFLYLMRETILKQSLPDDVAARVRAARRILVLTGACVSAESGVPTFRGSDAVTWQGRPGAQFSTAQMARENLQEVRAWFAYRRSLVGPCPPNAAHLALARWGARLSGLTLATQNIDGLHQAAGSREVLELHGSLWRERCEICAARYDISCASDNVNDETVADLPSACVACGGRRRPDVVLFGEMLPEEVWQAAAQAAQDCTLCIVAGTSGLVYPAAALPEIARQAGACLIEINTERTPLAESCQAFLAGPAGLWLPFLESL